MINIDINSDNGVVTGDAEELYYQLEFLLVQYAVFQPEMLFEALKQLNTMIADGTILELAKEMKENSVITVEQKGGMS